MGRYQGLWCYMANRVFLVAPEDLSVKMCQTRPLHKEDRVFLLSTDFDYPELTGKVSDFLEGKTTFCQIKEAGDINALVSVECVNEEAIYFIGSRMEQYYKDCKDEIIQKGHKVGKNRSFGVAKTPLRGKETQQTLEDFMGDMASALNTAPKPPRQDQSTDKKAMDEEETKSNGSTGNDPAGGDSSSQDENIRNQADVPIKQKREKSTKKEKQGKSGKPDRQQKDLAKTGSNDNMQSLESEIFGSQLVSEEKVTDDMRVSDAKANVTFAIFERLSKHICELTRKSFDQGECYKFVLLLRKTEDPEEFETSWKTVYSDPSFHILPDTYWILRNEATYYHKLCTVLYEEDVWIS